MRSTWQLPKIAWDVWRSNRSKTAVSILRQRDAYALAVYSALIEVRGSCWLMPARL